MDIGALKRKLEDYLPPERSAKVEEAYLYSKNAHSGQTRASGKPYIQHPVAVADILADWHADTPSLVAALLHDVVEDTAITLDQIQKHFGKDISGMVDGLSKIERLHAINRDIREAESFRKLLLAAASDWRVVFIKLADRLHNMRTLSSISGPEKRRRIARETLEVYAPIAGRLGIRHVQDELQNLAFRHMHPYRFRVLTKALKRSNAHSRQSIENVESVIRKGMEKYEIRADIKKRRKSLYSVHEKMDRKRLSFAQVEDIIGFRLVVEDRITCYQMMGVLHELFVPVPHRFRDFIAIPKSNGYQSLHTGFVTPNGIKVDVQIRSRAMDEVAENGLAAHWLYKRNENSMDKVQKEALQRLSSLVRLHAENATPREFMENIKIDLIPEEMYVLTPEGEIVTLSRGATALDMAYSIHTEVGDHAERAIINGQTLPVSVQLKSGDQVEIVTNEAIHPLPHWLVYAKTARARSRIRQVLHATARKESTAIGKNLLVNALRRLVPDIRLDDIGGNDWRPVLGGNNLKTPEDLYCALGLGEMLPDIVARALLKRRVKQQGPGEDGDRLDPISIAGAGRSAVQMSSCCYPLPYEPIVGILRKAHGLIIHSAECSAVRTANKRSERWTDVQWSDSADKRLHCAALRAQCQNRPGLIYTLSGVISDMGVNIVSFNFDGGAMEQESLWLECILEVGSLEDLRRVLSQLGQLPEVLQVSRHMTESRSNSGK